MDDNFMTAVLSDKACAELVIRIILDKNDIVVKHTRTQYPINSLKNHSVRLDVYAEDFEGTKYDIEIQRSDRGATPKREAAINLLKSTKLSPEEISQVLKIDKDIVDELSKQIGN